MGPVPRILLAFLAISGAANARDVSQLGPLRASTGEAVSGYLEVPALNDAGACIPVSLVRGAHDGPVLALIAGTHGYEYPGISALQRLRQSIDPQALRGIPAMTTETGQLGLNDESSIALAEQGIQNLMRHLGMLEGTAEPNNSVVWLTDYQVITSPVNGVFRATVRAPIAGVVNYVIGTPPK